MTHADFTDILIKTEPLSPDSTYQLVSQITQSPAPEIQTQLLTHSPSSTYSTIFPDGNYTTSDVNNEYRSTNLNTMRCGIPKNRTTTDTRPITPTTPSARGTCKALKSSILNKRKARGEVTPLLSPDDGPREYKLTKKEIERREARKEQNRRAARRCRIKKKRIQQNATQEMQNAMKDNVVMKTEVQNLRQQVTQLQQIILDHEKHQNCKLSPVQTVCQPHSITPQQKVKSEASLPQSSVSVDVGSARILAPCHKNSPLPSLKLFPINRCQFSPELNPYGNEFSNMNIENTTSYINPMLSNTTTTTANNDNKKNDNITPITTTLTNNTFISPTINNNSSTCFDSAYSGQEDPQDLVQIIEQYLKNESNVDPFETPKVDGEQNHESKVITNNTYDIITYPFSEDNLKNPVLTKATTSFSSSSKPPVARNLSKSFMQNEFIPSGIRPQHHSFEKNGNILLTLGSPSYPAENSPQASRLLQDSVPSPPIFNCVPPNLVQQPITPSNINNNNNSSSSNNTPFENEATLQNVFDNRTVMEFESDRDDLDELSCADIESLRQTFVNNQNDSPSFQPYTTLCQLPLPEISTLECSSNNNNNTIFSNFTGSTGEMAYQLSPISTPSPSSTSTLSSPGFLQSSFNDTCHSNTNTITAFDYNF